MKINRIILDANILIETVKNKNGVFKQIREAFPSSEIVISRPVLDELKKISGGKGKRALAARIAISLADKNQVGVKKTSKKGDDSLIELCGKDSILVTQDKELRRRCDKKGFLTGYLREKRHLIF